MLNINSWVLRHGKQAFHWAKEPTFRCPLAEAISDYHDALETTPMPPQIVAAAEALGADPALILRKLNHSGWSRSRVDGKLTDRCDTCGAKMKRLGFRCWIDEEVPPSERTSLHRLTSEMNRALSGGRQEAPRRMVRSLYIDTKREAEAWARHEHGRAKTKGKAVAR